MKREEEMQQCNWCNMTDDFEQDYIWIADYEFGKCLTSFDAILVEEKGQPTIGITVGDMVDENIPINYCPMCGRKLR